MLFCAGNLALQQLCVALLYSLLTFSMGGIKEGAAALRVRSRDLSERLAARLHPL